MNHMGLRMLGDSAWLFEAGGNDSRSRLDLILSLVEHLEQHLIPEVLDLVSSFDSLAVHFDPADGEEVFDWLTNLPPPDPAVPSSDTAKSIEIPVKYAGKSGPNLASIASSLGLSERELIALHSAADYTVAAVGFSPGFPYLLGLPEELRLPRLHTPRPVAAGSVAIACGQAGIYPTASQGGWHVLGRTATRLFDPDRSEPALLKPGDRVRFVPVESFNFPDTPDRPAGISNGPLEIISPGALTTVQDLGRPGFQSIGVSPGGAVDPVSARVANRLVGNPDSAAVLECSMTGPVLQFHQAVRVAWVGWADTRNGSPVEVSKGAKIDLTTRLQSLRGYIAVAGGIDVPQVLGSRATDMRAGFGGHSGRALRTGDRLATGPQSDRRAAGNWRVRWPCTMTEPPMIELRFLRGMQAGWFGDETRKTFVSATYQLSPVSDRTAARLDGPQLNLTESRELVSQPVVAGSVQVPPDGRPIVLMAERQTIGGYPQIGHVISADLAKLARAWPGTRIRFREVTIDEAREAWRELQRELALLQAGLNFFA